MRHRMLVVAGAFVLLTLALANTPVRAEMIVSDRTVEDMKEAEGALLAQWRKESATAGQRFEGGGTYTDPNGYVFKYSLTHPAKEEPGQKYPIFIGNTGWALCTADSQAQYPCYVLEMYTPNSLMTPNRKGGYSYPPDWKSVQATAYKVAVDRVVAENPNADASRVWVEGGSKYGTLSWISTYNYPDTFAAIVPSVCACDIYKALDISRRKIGIWMYYGCRDGGPVEVTLKTNPHWRTHPQIHKALTAAGYDPKFSVYTVGDHHEYGFSDSLKNPAWNDFTQLRKWLFAQKKPTMDWPVINSSPAASATLGQPFNYRTTANNEPQSFGAIITIEHAEDEAGKMKKLERDLPKGLTFDAKTGVLSGTPEEAGRFFIRLAATNDKGSGASTLELVIKDK